MKVKLQAKWFAPSSEFPYPGGDSRTRSGRRYTKGVHDMDPSMRQYLPSSAKVLDDPVEEPTVAPAPKKAPVKK